MKRFTSWVRAHPKAAGKASVLLGVLLLITPALLAFCAILWMQLMPKKPYHYYYYSVSVVPGSVSMAGWVYDLVAVLFIGMGVRLWRGGRRVSKSKPDVPAWRKVVPHGHHFL